MDKTTPSPKVWVLGSNGVKMFFAVRITLVMIYDNQFYASMTSQKKFPEKNFLGIHSKYDFEKNSKRRFDLSEISFSSSCESDLSTAKYLFATKYK